MFYKSSLVRDGYAFQDTGARVLICDNYLATTHIVGMQIMMFLARLSMTCTLTDLGQAPLTVGQENVLLVSGIKCLQ
jgi:hypothetical protein